MFATPHPPAQQSCLNTVLRGYSTGSFVQPCVRLYAPDLMGTFPDALPHGPIEEIFPDVFFVTGEMRTTFPEFPDVPWVFNRNMTIVREGGSLTLINSVRLDEQGLAALDALGEVDHLVRIGALHDRDDAFYVDRYRPTYWTIRGIVPEGLSVDKHLVPGGEAPFGGCTVFEFTTTAIPEGVLIVDRAGGIAVACDALQNWVKPDEFFTDDTVELMGSLGFWQPANIGPLFMMRSDPKAEDYARLLELPFRHALCGHGEPLRDSAHEDYSATVDRAFAS